MGTGGQNSVGAHTADVLAVGVPLPLHGRRLSQQRQELPVSGPQCPRCRQHFRRATGRCGSLAAGHSPNLLPRPSGTPPTRLDPPQKHPLFPQHFVHLPGEGTQPRAHAVLVGVLGGRGLTCGACRAGRLHPRRPLVDQVALPLPLLFCPMSCGHDFPQLIVRSARVQLSPCARAAPPRC